MVSNIPTFLDYKLARRSYDESGFYRPDKTRALGDQGFAMFSPAYACSNEEVARVAKLLKPCGKTALAVAGSGDMTFVLTASGATKVDMFDVSKHADLMAKVKIAMLQSGMNLKQYRIFLKGVQNQGHFFTNGKMIDIVSGALTSNEIEYLDGMSGCRIVRNTKSQNWFPYIEQYRLIQNTVNKPYNFIMAGINNIFDYIGNKKYDIVYLSNVFDYVVDSVTREPDELAISYSLEKFAGCLNDKGMIVVNSLMRPIRKYDIKLYLENIAKRVRHCGDIVYNEHAKAMFLKAR